MNKIEEHDNDDDNNNNNNNSRNNGKNNLFSMNDRYLFMTLDFFSSFLFV